MRPQPRSYVVKRFYVPHTKKAYYRVRITGKHSEDIFRDGRYFYVYGSEARYWTLRDAIFSIL